MEMIMHDQSNDNQPPDPKEEESSKRLKRDEWSEGAVDCLLDVYESKWVLRNRAKLKGHDWEEVARRVSSRANSNNSTTKTSTQCKNKIESMKKRYRSESAAGSGSRWPLFSRIDGLVRYRTAPTDLVFFDQNTVARAPLATETDQNSQSVEHNALQAQATKAQEDRIEGNGGVQHDEREKEVVNNATSIYDAFNEKKKIERNKGKRKEREEEEEEECDVMESIQWLAEVALRMEQARIKNMREVEKIRAEAEAKKGEMDLKRTKIIANTQLQIAKILARSGDLDSLWTADYLFPLGI